MNIYRSEILVPVQVTSGQSNATISHTKPNMNEPMREEKGAEIGSRKVSSDCIDSLNNNNNSVNEVKFKCSPENHHKEESGTTTRIGVTKTQEKPTSYSSHQMYSTNNNFEQTTKGNAINNDYWFDDMRRRFDDRRQRWNDDSQRMRQDFFIKPNYSTMPQQFNYSTPAGNFMETNPFQTCFERSQKDDIVRFVARFNIPDGIKPEDVAITTKFYQLTVSGRTENRNGNNISMSEYNKTIDLPKGIIEDQISATLTADHVLIVECPMEPPSITNAINNTVPIKHTDQYSFEKDKYSGSTRSFSSPTHVMSEHKVIHTPVIDSLGMQRGDDFKIDVPIGNDYLPEEIQVKTMNRRVYINARHEEKFHNKTSFREFSKEYDIPSHINSESIQAKFENGILHITATI